MTVSKTERYDFASDTVSGMCPAVLEAFTSANEPAFAPSYGEDVFTHEVQTQLSRLFGRPCQVFMVASGTAGNALALSFLAQPQQSIICHPHAHIACDEANAPEFFTGGAKLLYADGPLGKIDTDCLQRALDNGRGYHSADAAVVSVTQATEQGTVYSLAELQAIFAMKARYPALAFHLDGARLANAVVATGQSVAELTDGFDIVTFGGSKNGGAPCEAVVCFDPQLSKNADALVRLKRRLKRAGQMPAKIRFFSAPFLALLQNDVWLQNARAANQRARQLGAAFRELGYEPAVPVQTNQVFVKFSTATVTALEQEGWHFHFFPTVQAHRFVCSWDTSEQAIDDLVHSVRRAQAR